MIGKQRDRFTLYLYKISDGIGVAWNQHDNYIFFYGNGNANHHSGTNFLVDKRIKLAVKRVEFVSDGCCCCCCCCCC